MNPFLVLLSSISISIISVSVYGADKSDDSVYVRRCITNSGRAITDQCIKSVREDGTPRLSNKKECEKIKACVIDKLMANCVPAGGGQTGKDEQAWRNSITKMLSGVCDKIVDDDDNDTGVIF